MPLDYSSGILNKMKINLYKIKDGKLETWLEWGNLLETTYKEEAVETLKEEGVTTEAFGLFELNGENYTLGISMGENLPANLKKEINIKHKEVKKECLIFIKKVDLVYFLQN